jgi:hypothetical protein
MDGQLRKVSFIHEFILKLSILGNNKMVVKPQHVMFIYSKVLRVALLLFSL